MYEKFTARARKVMQLACEEAQRFNHEYIGTEHILLGLIREGTGVAANVLVNLEINLNKVRQEVVKIVQPGPDYVTMGKLPMTPRAKKILEHAIEAAKSLKHNYLGTEHLLLGTLRESEGVAAQVLMNLGLRLSDVRKEILKLLGDGIDRDNLPVQPPIREEDQAEDWSDEDREEIPKELEHLPPAALEIFAEYDCQIDVIQEEKLQAVADQDFGRAAELRDLERKLTMLRELFLSYWPKNA